MITREEILEFVGELNNACYDFPFEGDFYSAVLRHRDSKKWFGILLRAPENYFKKLGVEGFGNGTEVINLKCPPDLQPFLLQKYTGVLPAYHMNKVHWISVVLSSDIPIDDVKQLIRLSYDITS